MPGRKYNVILQNDDCSRESTVRTLVFRNEVHYQRKCHYRIQYGNDPPSDKAIRRWLKQVQETGNVLHRKGAGRSSTSQEVVDPIQEAWAFHMLRKARMLKLFSILQH
jgi:arsenate reductase-like glutaredoxin family protein